jgi:hypothetical protein
MVVVMVVVISISLKTEELFLERRRVGLERIIARYR